MPSSLAHLLPLLLSLLGGLLAWLGWRSVRVQLERRRTWRPERGTVVGYHWSGPETQHWVIERLDSTGRTRSTHSPYGAGHGTLRSFPFDIDILVDPQDEGRFVPAGGCRSGMADLVFVVGGGFLVALGVGVTLLLAG